MKIGPKYKICKRLGGGIFEKCQTQKFQIAEARARKRGSRRRGMSDYGKQLLEKQKVRFSYGITEKQLRKYVSSSTLAQDAVSAIYSSLEMRLDNVVYRAGLASTRRMARQLVAHGHITVNGRKLKVPSYATKVDDEIAV
jgi:small subunit ribosomal protein S4